MTDGQRSARVAELQGKADELHQLALGMQNYTAEKNVTLYKAAQLRDQARRLAAPGLANKAQLVARVAFYGGRCAYCGGPWENEERKAIDHVIPIARGGTHWPSNRRPACRSCNTRKSSMPLRAWREVEMSYTLNRGVRMSVQNERRALDARCAKEHKGGHGLYIDEYDPKSGKWSCWGCGASYSARQVRQLQPETSRPYMPGPINRLP